MAVSRSGNAMMAKAHCLYGKRLNDGDYRNLLQKRTIGEIAGYLKSQTYYSAALTEVKEELIHREQLESLLSRYAHDAYMRLTKYSYGDEALLKIYVMQSEAEQLIAAARLLSAGAMDRFIADFPAYLSRHMSFDLFAVAACKTYDDLLNAVEGTGYYQVLGRFRPVSSSSRTDITALETGILTHYYEKILGLVRESYSGRARESLEKMIRLRVDLHNLGVIYRMKRYFGKDRAAVSARLLPVRSLISSKVYDEMLGAQDYAEVTETFSRQPVFRMYPVARGTGAERMITQLQRVKRQIARTQFRFSIEPAVAVYAYMTMLDIEIRNIVNIVEGVRYELPQNEIREMLVV